MMIRSSLRNKVIFVFLLPTLLTVLLYGLLTYFSVRQELEAELGQRLTAVAQTMAADMSEGIDAAQIARLEPQMHRVQGRLRERLERVREATGVRRILIFDREHRSLVDTDDEGGFGQTVYRVEADRVELEQTFEHARPTTSPLFAADDGELHKMGYAPLLHDGEVVAAIGVEASAGYFALLTNLTRMLIVLGVVSLLLVVAVGTLFARAITRPVNDLVEAARRLGRGHWNEPLALPAAAAGSTDEIGFLARAFEEMRQGIVQRDRQMQMMLSGIAHEVRNPLGGMELFCGLLREDLEAEQAALAEPTAPSRQLEMVRKIQRELRYLEKVVRDFLDFARATPLERERFSAREFTGEIAGLMAAEIDDAGCTFAVHIEDENTPEHQQDARVPGTRSDEATPFDDVELTGDRERLRRAVINIVRNAYQACAGGGHIALTVRVGHGHRELEIRDDGPGIPPEQLAQICTPFFTTREKGSGLGLALARQTLEQHGGELRIESAPGRGTTVRLVVPYDPTLEVRAPEPAAIPEGWLG